MQVIVVRDLTMCLYIYICSSYIRIYVVVMSFLGVLQRIYSA